jgi:hypothetical protein
MPVTDTFKAAPDQFLEALGLTQQLVLTGTSAWVTTTKSFTPDISKVPFSNRMPDAVALTGNAFDFAAKLLASQRDFSIKLVETCVPAPAAAKPKTA